MRNEARLDKFRDLSIAYNRIHQQTFRHARLSESLLVTLEGVSATPSVPWIYTPPLGEVVSVETIKQRRQGGHVHAPYVGERRELLSCGRN